MKFLVFPGQGSQYSGMGKDWFDNFKEAKLAFEEASDFSGLKLQRLCFEGAEIDLRQTEITQPAILTTTVAIFRSLKATRDISFANSVFAGHSLGEYSALVCAGALSLGEAARLVHHRGKYMQEAVPAGVGAMAALVFRPKVEGSYLAQALCFEVSQQLRKCLSVANFNSPEQIVIAGHSEAVARASELALLEPYGARKVVELKVSAPFHCELMRAAADRLGPELESVSWKSPALSRYIANVDAGVYTLADSIAKVPALLASQITASVRWVESVQRALALGCTEAVEIGPSKVLSGLINRISLEGRSLETRNIDRWEDFKNDEFKI